VHADRPPHGQPLLRQRDVRDQHEEPDALHGLHSDLRDRRHVPLPGPARGSLRPEGALRPGRQPAHRSRKVRAWLADHPDHIELSFLPSYSPELNPDELIRPRLRPPRPAPGQNPLPPRRLMPEAFASRLRVVPGFRIGEGCTVAPGRQLHSRTVHVYSRCQRLSGASSLPWWVLVGCCQAVHDGSGSEAGFWRHCRGDHLGTTRCARPRTTQALPHVFRLRKAPYFRGIRRSHLTGGQGVAGSNPVVPTSVFAGRRPFPQ
jgi:hypothetical protein